MLFSLDEFLERIIDYVNKIDIGAKWGSVTYRDILTAYSIDLLNDDERYNYNRFFNKDIPYRWQNEWRLMLVNQTPLIGPNENHCIAEIKTLNWFHIGSINDLRENKIVIKEEPEKN